MNTTLKTLLLISLFLASCQGEVTSSSDRLKEGVVLEQMTNDSPDAAIEDVEKVEDIPTIYATVATPSKNGLTFGYANFIVNIDEMGVEPENTHTITKRNDTSFYDLEMGEHINDVNLRVSTYAYDAYTKFEVFQRSILNFSISNEGGHCDLDEVDPYYTKWTALHVNELNASFQTPDRDEIQLPKINMSDSTFYALVLEHCGERYASLLNHEGKSSCNAHLSTSGYELKIRATRKDGSIQNAYIILSAPMGC